MQIQEPTKVIVAMSGGVDSSVAALLLKQAGHEVIGVTMRLYSIDQEKLPAYYKGCCSIDDVEDARRVCQLLEIPHYVMDVQKEFQKHVIDYFLSEYQNGSTPHPCIACNDKIKFSFLMQRANYLGAKFISTGHHARIQYWNDSYHLLRSSDIQKDQSYVLYGMGQHELSHTLMPVGWYSKEQIRTMAVEANFPNADKPDSQDICFIPFGDYRKFLEQRVNSKPGRLVDYKGNVLGSHLGVERFTIGQRRGLGIQSVTPLYVTKIDANSGDVTVGPEEQLFQDTLWTSHVRFVSDEAPANGTKVNIKIRYKSSEVSAFLYPKGENVFIRLESPQKAITPGQAAVFYNGEEVLGGGRIASAPKLESIIPSAA